MQETENKTVTLPKISESVHSARVVKWLKKVGDRVKLDEALVEVSTAKVNSEIPSPFEGVLASIAVNETEELAVGSVLCTIAKEGFVSHKSSTPKNSFLSPAVLKMANENGLCVQSLQQIKGSGIDNRVTKNDVQSLLDDNKSKDCVVNRTDLSKSLMRSHQTIPDASLIIDLNMQIVFDWMKNNRTGFEKDNGVKITYTAHLLKAIGFAMKEFQHLQYNGACNIGVAVQKGETLFVPVLEHVDTLSLKEIAVQLDTLQSTTTSDSQKAKITLSNFGKSGVQIGLPIVPEGQSAILAVGAVEKRVAVTDDNAIRIQANAWATLAFDHRIFDGMYGSAFLAKLNQSLCE